MNEVEARPIGLIVLNHSQIIDEVVVWMKLITLESTKAKNI